MTLKSLLVACFALATVTAHAVPAYPGLQRVTQPDGTVLTFRLTGDEHSHAFVTDDNVLLFRRDDGTMEYARLNADGIIATTGITAHPASMRTDSERALIQHFDGATRETFTRKAAARRAPVEKLAGSFPTMGEMPGVVLMVEFANNEFYEEHTRDVFQRAMTEENWSGYNATGSVRDYYRDQSMGQFVPNFEVYGPIKLPRTLSHYGANDSQGNDAHATEMVTTACQIAHDSLGVDFSRYDYDGDGNVDFVYIYYAGYAESYGASSNTIWPHASNLLQTGGSIELDGKHIGRYACSSELKGVSGHTLEGIGTFCHEFAHVLGLPDMYNTFSSSSVQLGAWDLLDAGSYNNNAHTPPALSAYERSFLGWLQLTEIDTPAERMELPELTEHNVAFRISTANPDEYFTLENRQQRGWDAAQPGKGLMIIHVAYDKGAWEGNYVNAGSIQRYDLVEADGTQQGAQATDLYPTADNDMFTDYSVPSSLAWDGTPTGKGVSRIKDEDGLITFRFMRDRLAAPHALDATDIAHDAFTAQWEAVDEALRYNLHIAEELTDDENPLLFADDFGALTAGRYPNSSSTDIASSLDDYLTQAGWSGTNLFSCGGYLRIGGYGQDGLLRSPAIASQHDELTVAFHARAYTAKRVSYTVSLGDDEGLTQTFTADRNETLHELHFANVPAGARLTIATDKERLFLNDLRMLKGHYEGDEVWAAGPKAWTVEGIEDTSYRVDGLVAGRSYSYTVSAADDEEGRTSVASNAIVVRTATADGISAIATAATLPARVTYYDLQGRRIARPAKGIAIRRTVSATGSVITEKVAVSQ